MRVTHSVPTLVERAVGQRSSRPSDGTRLPRRCTPPSTFCNAAILLKRDAFTLSSGSPPCAATSLNNPKQDGLSNTVLRGSHSFERDPQLHSHCPYIVMELVHVQIHSHKRHWCANVGVQPSSWLAGLAILKPPLYSGWFVARCPLVMALELAVQKRVLPFGELDGMLAAPFSASLFEPIVFSDCSPPPHHCHLTDVSTSCAHSLALNVANRSSNVAKE